MLTIMQLLYVNIRLLYIDVYSPVKEKDSAAGQKKLSMNFFFNFTYFVLLGITDNIPNFQDSFLKGHDRVTAHQRHM